MARTTIPMTNGVRVMFNAGGRYRGKLGTVRSIFIHGHNNVRVMVQFDGSKYETDCAMDALTLI